jgi:chromosome segregation ATPase
MNYVYNRIWRRYSKSGGFVKTLETEIQNWLKSTKRHQDALDIATLGHRRANRRLKDARESLEEAVAELYGEGEIIGRNKEERDACLRRLTAMERAELNEAEASYDEAVFALERARADLSRDRQDRYGLQMRVALASCLPPVIANVRQPALSNPVLPATVEVLTVPFFDNAAD